MKVKINEWTAIGIWKWKDFGDEVCGICRVQFEGTCPECIYPGEGCPPVKGTCSHAFHKHCIRKWIEMAQSENLCPMCRQPWNTAQDASWAAGNERANPNDGLTDGSMFDDSVEMS